MTEGFFCVGKYFMQKKIICLDYNSKSNQI